MYTTDVVFEWDSRQGGVERQKHGIRFSDALGVFEDDYGITIRDDDSDPDEERFVTLGLGIKGAVLVVAYCYRAQNIRLISARPAERTERAQYEAQR